MEELRSWRCWRSDRKRQIHSETRTDFHSSFLFSKYCCLPWEAHNSQLTQTYLQPKKSVTIISVLHLGLARSTYGESVFQWNMTWLFELLWFSRCVLVMRRAKLEGFIPKHLAQPCVKQTVPNMSCSAAVNLLVCYGHGSVVLVPKKLIHWYVTSVGLLAAYPNKARAPCLSIWRSQTWSSLTGRVRQPADLSRFSEQWKVAQPLVMSAFYLTLVGLMFSGGWAVGGESH